MMGMSAGSAIILAISGLVGLVTWIWLIVLAFKQAISWGLTVLIAPFLLGFIAMLVLGGTMFAGGSGSFIYIATAITLLPFLIFGFKFFRETKVPLILFLLVNIISAYFTAQMMNAMGMNEMMAIQQDMMSGKITEEEAQQRMLAWAEKLEQSGMLSESDQRDLEMMREMMQQQRTGPNTGGYDDSHLIPKTGEQSAADKYDPYAEAAKREAESRRRLEQKLAERARDKSRFTRKPEPTYFNVSYFKIKNYRGREVKVTGLNGAVHQGILSNILTAEDKIVVTKELKTGTADFIIHRADIKQILVKK